MGPMVEAQVTTLPYKLNCTSYILRSFCLFPFVLFNCCNQSKLKPVGELHANNSECVQVLLVITVRCVCECLRVSL